MWWLRMVDEMQKQNDFETACKNLIEGISIFKEEILYQNAQNFGMLNGYLIKVQSRFARLMKTAKKKRCKVGICYIVIALTNTRNRDMANV